MGPVAPSGGGCSSVSTRSASRDAYSFSIASGVLLSWPRALQRNTRGSGGADKGWAWVQSKRPTPVSSGRGDSAASALH